MWAEVFKTGNIETVYNTLDELKDLHPDFISVTYGAGGSENSSNTLNIANRIKNVCGVESVVHMPCINMTKSDADKVLTVPIKVQLGGNPAGVREGGNLQKGIDTIKISCLPKDLPVRIIADISDLKIGDKMAVKQIALPEGVKVVSNGDAVIATIKAPRR